MSHASNTLKPVGPVPDGTQPPTTHGATVVGWLVVCFAVIPLAMWGAGDGDSYMLGGIVMAAAGLGLVVYGRLALRRPRT